MGKYLKYIRREHPSGLANEHVVLIGVYMFHCLARGFTYKISVYRRGGKNPENKCIHTDVIDNPDTWIIDFLKNHTDYP